MNSSSPKKTETKQDGCLLSTSPRLVPLRRSTLWLTGPEKRLSTARSPALRLAAWVTCVCLALLFVACSHPSPPQTLRPDPPESHLLEECPRGLPIPDRDLTIDELAPITASLDRAMDTCVLRHHGLIEWAKFITRGIDKSK